MLFDNKILVKHFNVGIWSYCLWQSPDLGFPHRAFPVATSKPDPCSKKTRERVEPFVFQRRQRDSVHLLACAPQLSRQTHLCSVFSVQGLFLREGLIPLELVELKSLL